MIGAVAEIITVPQEFSQALEAVLAGQLQNVVVTTDEAAKQAINYLRANKLGRANLFTAKYGEKTGTYHQAKTNFS